MDQPLTDRRIDARFALPRTAITRATLRPGCAVRVVNLSAGGALVQAEQPIRPGARVHFQIVTNRPGVRARRSSAAVRSVDARSSRRRDVSGRVAVRRSFRNVLGTGDPTRVRDSRYVEA